MKVIFNTFIFLLYLVLLSHCRKDDPIVNIPDNNFLIALIEQGVDSNGDGIISPAEAEAITFLDVSSDSISNLTGIGKFINLDTLDCSHNNLNSLDLSECTALRYLNCRGNQLTTIDVSNNTSLKDLSCSYNQLITLDVSNNTKLGYLSCGGNQLTTIDISRNTMLWRFHCSYNQLTSLDVSNNNALEIFACNGNQLTSLDFSKNIDLSRMYLSNMPSLTKVCVWELPFPPTGVEVHTFDSPNVYFTTDCN